MGFLSRLFGGGSEDDKKKNIVRYSKPTGEAKLSDDTAGNLEAITAHVEKYWGKIETVFHEKKSEYVHIDVLWVKPTAERNFHTLITSGMSDRPMQVEDKEDAQFAHAELVVSLPADWPVGDSAEENYWPIHWLKTIARFPHEYGAFISIGHTIPNGDPPEAFASNTDYCCWLLSLPLLCDKPGRSLTLPDGKTIYFRSLIPLYPEEVDFKLEHGFDAFMEKFLTGLNTEQIDLKRRNLCIAPPPFTPNPADPPLVTAQKFLDRWVELGNAFDPALTDMYADECTYTINQRQPDGTVKTKQMGGKQLKPMFKMMLTAANPRTAKNFELTDIKLTEENGYVRVHATKINHQKNTRLPMSAVFRKFPDGRWLIVEETGEV